MKVKVEIADTPYKLATGLMFRHELPSDSGMLFVFPNERVLSFWGENTFLPLDIAFIDRGHKIVKCSKIEKMSRQSVSSGIPCVMAVEVNSGFLSQNGIKEGDVVRVFDDKFDGTTISFEKSEGNSSLNDEYQTKMAAWWNPLDWFKNLRKKKQDDPANTDIPSVPPMPVDPSVPSDAQQEENLPAVNFEEIPFADEDAEPDEQSLPEQDQPEQGQPEQEDIEQPEVEQPEVEKPIPDASMMSVSEAVSEAIKNGYVTRIVYITKPSTKKTLGPKKPGVSIQRIVQPHGIYHAKTGNNVLVTWDLTVSDFRAFIIDRIQEKSFTGQTFKKWFAVKG